MRFASLIAVVAVLIAGHAQARDQIRIVGSSTVFPFVSAAAEQFGQGGKFKTPIVEATGTGGGFKFFCAGIGKETPDIANASRAITEGEKAACKAAGVKNVVEIPLGYDGIVIAAAKGAASFALSKQQIFLALANRVPDATGALVPNPYTQWNQIDAQLPAQKIEVYGPPPTSGTRDAFVELVMEEGCKTLPAIAKAIPDEKARKKSCALMREDGAYIDAGEDDNVILQKIVSNTNALGIFGYSFLEANLGKVRAHSIDGVAPTTTTIEDGSYKVARLMYVYVKGDHVGIIPGLAEFAKHLASKDAVGLDGYLTAKGLLPLHADMQKLARERAISLKR